MTAKETEKVIQQEAVSSALSRLRIPLRTERDLEALELPLAVIASSLWNAYGMFAHRVELTSLGPVIELIAAVEEVSPGLAAAAKKLDSLVVSSWYYASREDVEVAEALRADICKGVEALIGKMICREESEPRNATTP